MCITLFVVMYVAVLHFVGDFYFQTTEMAVGKSKSNYILVSHVLTYSIVLLAGSLFLAFVGIPLVSVLLWVLVNGLIHFCIDYFTSRVNAKITAKEGMGHNFFVMVGFDQLLHIVTLILTLGLIVF